MSTPDPILSDQTLTDPTGRAISARNATTHGLFARDVVLPALGEDPAAFDELLRQFCAQLPPRNLLERHYLEQIAAASWRLRRLHRWQAQVYEDDTLTDEDQRLDRLDKTLRHETTLTRQIDRAVRTLSRDLRSLFEGRARDEAFYQRDLTPNEVRAEPELEIQVQRDIWRRLRPAPTPDLSGVRLDNTGDDTGDHSEREHGPFASDAPPTPTLFRAAPFTEDLSPPQANAQKCENENRENEPASSPAPPTPPPSTVAGAGGPPNTFPLKTRKKCENESREDDTDPDPQIARQKRLQELLLKIDPTTPQLDWDSEDMQQAYKTHKAAGKTTPAKTPTRKPIP